MSIVIDIEDLAIQLADSLQITDSDIELLKTGAVPDGWSYALLDILEDEYRLETKLREELTK